MTADEFVNLSVGKPWKDRSYGPDSYDCWGLIIKYFEQVKGIKIPVVKGYKTGKTDIVKGFLSQVDSGKWKDSEAKDGVVFMAFAGDVPAHCGVVIGDFCLHALGSDQQPGQVCYHRLRVISRMYSRVQYWEFKGK